MQPKSWYLKLREVSCKFPVFIIMDSGAARESDGDPISCVRLRFGEFSPCDLPHGSFLSVVKSGHSVVIKKTSPNQLEATQDT